MASANAIATNAISLIILAIIFANISKRAEHSFMQHKLFMAMLAVLTLLLLADSIGRLTDGIPGSVAYYANWISMLALYALAPTLPALYMLYAYYEAYQGEKRLKPLIWPLALYAALDAAFNLSSVFTGWTFTIGAGNVYSRGPYLFAHLLLCYMALAYTFVFILRNRKRIGAKRFLPLLALGLLPVAAGALQQLMLGLSVIMPSMSLSVLLLYLSIQDRRLDTDYLTGVYNRRLLDSYLKELMQAGSVKKAFSAVLIDLDNFKEINDTLGHDAGDSALTDAVGLLRECLRRGDFISRYGGDEFIILLDIGSRILLEETVGRLRERFRQFNESNRRPYRLGFSLGYDVYDTASGMPPEQFIKHVDWLMYEEKRKKSRAMPVPET